MSLNYTRVPAVSYPPLKRPSVFSIAGDTLPTFTQAESSQPDHNVRIARARPDPAFSHRDERYSREKTAKCVSDDGGDETESLTELSTTEETSSTSDFALIAKPPGEVGRPGRGGYNLQKVLENHGWDKNSFSIRRRYVCHLIDKHLDRSVSYTHQDEEAVQLVFKSATKRYPQFNDFEQAWPLADMCKMRLKYMASQTKRNAEKHAAEVLNAQLAARIPVSQRASQSTRKLGRR